MWRERILSLMVVGTTLLATAPPAWSAGSVVLTLDGKPVTSVPVDKLGAITVTVNGGGAFKSVYAGQMSGIDQALNVVATRYVRSGAKPGLDSSHTWNGYIMGQTSQDTGWSAKSTLSAPMTRVAKDWDLQRADTNDNVAITVRLRRKVYTGKTIWVNGGYVKETRWETVGPSIGDTTLKLDPPTMAASLDDRQMLTHAVAKTQMAPDYAQWLLYPDSFSGRTVTFNGSRITAAEPVPGKPMAYSWNWEGNDQVIYAKTPINLKLHAAMQSKSDGMPFASSTEADFVVPMKNTALYRMSTGQWEWKGFDWPDDARKLARTTDGKTADQVSGGGSPAAGLKNDSTVNNPNASAEDKAKSILKGLGF